MTLAPVLCSFLFHNKREEKDTIVDRIMKRGYLTHAQPGARHRYLVLAVMGACWSSRRAGPRAGG